MKIETIYKTVLWYCLECQKNTKSKNSKFWKTKNGRVTLFLKCAIHDNKISRFTKDHEASGLLSVLKIETPLIRIPLVGPMLL